MSNTNPEIVRIATQQYYEIKRIERQLELMHFKLDHMVVRMNDLEYMEYASKTMKE